MIMEAEKSQDLPSAIWGPGEMTSSSSLSLKAGGPGKPVMSSSLKVCSLKTQERLMFQSESKDWKWPMSQLKQVGGVFSYSAFLFYLGLQLIGWGPPTLGRTTCFTQSTDSNVNLTQKHPHRQTHNNVSPNIWAPCTPVKLIHEINYHKWWITLFFFPNVETFLYSWNKHWLVVIDYPLLVDCYLLPFKIYCWIWFVKILLKFFTSLFMKITDLYILKNSCNIFIKIMLPSWRAGKCFLLFYS